MKMLPEYLERALSLESCGRRTGCDVQKRVAASGGVPKAGNEAYFSSSCPRARNAGRFCRRVLLGEMDSVKALDVSLAKNGPEQVCDVPSDEAGNDGQYQRWISAIE